MRAWSLAFLAILASGLSGCGKDGTVGEGGPQRDQDGAWRCQRVAVQMNRARPYLEGKQQGDGKRQRLDAIRHHASDALMKSNSSRRNRKNSGFSRVVN